MADENVLPVAVAYQVEVYEWWCERCNKYKEGFDSYYAAADDADRHNLEEHGIGLFS